MTEDKISDQTRPDVVTLVTFAVFVMIIAANFVAVRFTNRELPPFWGAGTRFTLAAGLFLLYALARRLALPRGRALVGVIAYGLLSFGLGYAFAYWALVEVPAGLASVIFALTTLFTLIFAAMARLEPFRMRGVAGSLIAIAGIAVMFGLQVGKDIPVVYIVAALAMSASFALGGVVVKAFPKVPLAMTNAVGMISGAPILLGLSVASGEAQVIPQNVATWVAQLYLILPGGVGLFALFIVLIRRWTASAVSYQAVLAPPVTALLSAVVLGEALTLGLFLGGALVLAGVYVGALAPDRAAQRKTKPQQAQLRPVAGSGPGKDELEQPGRRA